MPNCTSVDVLTLDDLIAAAFDRSGLVTSNPKVAAELASRTIARWLARTGRVDLARLLSSNASMKSRHTSAKGGLQVQAA